MVNNNSILVTWVILMPAAVKLHDLIDAVDGQPETVFSFLDRETGEVYSISEEALRIAEDGTNSQDEVPEWQQEEIGWARRIAASDRYVALPTSWDVHAGEIMQQFSYSFADDRVCGEFLTAIRGRGAFRRFKEQLTRYDLWDTWHEFRRQALRQQLIDWCEARGIPVREGVDAR